MTSPRLRRFTAPPSQVTTALDALRERYGLVEDFPAPALAQAQAAATAWEEDGPARFLAHGHGDGLPVRDARDLPLVTIDPPGSLDLDQAVHLARLGQDGDAPTAATYRVTYAIASLATFVAPGGPLAQALAQRGTTVYAPDHSTPLHPEVLSHGAASLLEGQERPACLWTIDLDARGEVLTAHVERALVRSRARLSYAQVQAALDAPGDPAAALPSAVPTDLPGLLAEIGRLRQEREAERGGVSLSTPEQEVTLGADGRYHLSHRASLPVEGWNAQVSLLTGMCAAAIMLKAGAGVLRTMPPADPEDVQRLRRVAHALGVHWPATTTYAQLVRTLDPAVPGHAAFAARCTSLFRGAGYTAFGTADLPAPTGADALHGAIAAPYAHVTAPLRRLVDRAGLEVCLAACAGASLPTHLLDELATLPETMAATARVARGVERGAVDAVEALVLAGHEGEVFTGVVTSVREGRGEITLADPAVTATVQPRPGQELPVGQQVRARLVSVDPAQGRTELALV